MICLYGLTLKHTHRVSSKPACETNSSRIAMTFPYRSSSLYNSCSTVIARPPVPGA